MFAAILKEIRMKKIVVYLNLCLAVLLVTGQSQEIAPGDSVPWEIRKQSLIYNAALSFNDPAVAKMALYNLIAENPGNPTLYDSLARLYHDYNEPVSAALVAQQAMALNPNDMYATEIAAESFNKLGAKDKALGFYEKLYLNGSNITVLYKMSFVQMELQRFAEANTSLDIVIGDPTSKENTIIFPTIDQLGQEVSLDIAAHRVKAMIEEAKGNVEEAKVKYLKVLEMKPGFQVVQQQLRELTKAQEGGE